MGIDRLDRDVVLERWERFSGPRVEWPRRRNTPLSQPGVLARQRRKGWAIESGTGEPIVAAQAAMLAVHWAMTAPKPVDRTMRFYSW